MSAALHKPSFDLQSELDRKVLDTLSVLNVRYSSGQITECQLSEGIATLYRATYGLTLDLTLQDIMDEYEPVVKTKAAYISTLSKHSEELIVYWQVNREFITIFSSVSGTRKVKIPEAADPHLHYNKIINHLENKGWEHYDS